MKAFPLLLLLLLTIAAVHAGPKEPPAPGSVFRVSGDSAKYVSADIEFRDPAGGKWPTFAYGKPAGEGSVTFDSEKPAAALTLVCDHIAQDRGDQSRRVAGEAVTTDGGSLPVTFQVARLAPTRIVKRAVKEKNGKVSEKEIAVTPAEAQLSVGGKTTRVTAEMTSSYPGPDKTLALTFRFEVKGADLGFRTHPGVIAVTVSCSGFPVKP